MVKIKVTERISTFLEEVLNSKEFTKDEEVLRLSKEEGGVEIAVLDRVCRQYREKNPSKKIWLHDLVKGSKAYFPPKPVVVRSAELEKRLLEVKHEVDNRRYYKMVTDVSFVRKQESYRDSSELRTFRSQASVGVNIIFTVVSFFVAGFFGTKYYTGNSFFALIVGLFCGIAGLVMDTFLFVLRGTRVDSGIDKRDQLEKKTFSPFADPTDQLDSQSRFSGVDLDEVLRKARESKDDVVVLDNYESRETEEKIGKETGAKNNPKDKAAASPQVKNNKKDKSSGKVKTA